MQLLSFSKLNLLCSGEIDIEHKMQHLTANLATNIGYMKYGIMKIMKYCVNFP